VEFIQNVESKQKVWSPKIKTMESNILHLDLWCSLTAISGEIKIVKMHTHYFMQRQQTQQQRTLGLYSTYIHVQNAIYKTCIYNARHCIIHVSLFKVASTHCYTF